MLLVEILLVQTAIVLLDEFLITTRELLLQCGECLGFAFGIADLPPRSAGRGTRATFCFVDGVIGIATGSPTATFALTSITSTRLVSSWALTRTLTATRSRTAVRSRPALLLLLFGLFDQLLEHGDDLVLFFLGILTGFLNGQPAAGEVHSILDIGERAFFNRP